MDQLEQTVKGKELVHCRMEDILCISQPIHYSVMSLDTYLVHKQELLAAAGVLAIWVGPDEAVIAWVEQAIA